MSDDLYEVWRDDRLIEAAARGDLLELADDPAAGPLLALTEVADGRPLPRFDIDGAALVDSRRNRRYAVRSLAVAVTAVATLSTSGVAAVVTGDPLRPAKAVWQQIQDHTGLRADDDAGADSGAALGGSADAPLGAGAESPKPPAVLPAAGPPVEGVTARAPFRTDEQGTGAETVQPDGADFFGGAQAEESEPTGAESDDEQSQAPDSSQDSADSTESSDTSQTSDPSEPSEPSEPTDPEQQEPGDESGSEPAPEGQQPAPDDGSDDGLEDLVRKPSDRLRPAPTLPEDGVADHEQVLRVPLSGLSDATGDTTGDTTDDTTDDSTSDGSTDSTGTGTLAAPTVSP